MPLDIGRKQEYSVWSWHKATKYIKIYKFPTNAQLQDSLFVKVMKSPKVKGNWEIFSKHTLNL